MWAVIPVATPITSLPAVVTVYDPRLGGINSNDDPEHFASNIPVTEEWYGVAAACDPSLLGWAIDLSWMGEFKCVDTGGKIKSSYSKYHKQQVLFFDILWPLEEEGEYPDWNYSLIEDWSVIGG
jgi:hypothetical protein